jgi:microcystin-dependent protein
MAQPYIGEIRMFGGTFAPAGWLFCDGSVLAISEYDTLFNLIGTTYGGDGQSTFQLPDLRGRVPIHWGTDSSTGSSFQIGQAAGTETVTLTTQQIPQHNHLLMATNVAGNKATPVNSILANSQGTFQPYIQESPDNTLSSGALSLTGNGQPHDNMQPFLCVSFIISLYGIYPSPT